ncbi:MAG TPA: pyridoxine 5'-phosphate synthase [Planctomycetaceae bacterium]|nr:pyridoxine 5'-phosphate synthase [Planctomycetaceae bacterium]
MVELGVNIDHVATIRQARETFEPDPAWAATFAELGGADGITIHLREDRRHIQDRDVEVLKQTVTAKLNLEMACVDDIVDMAIRLRPDQITLVPEKREEVTTEGGLDMLTNPAHVRSTIQRLQDAGLPVSLFLDPNLEQIEAALALQVEAVELHTGTFANAAGEEQQAELQSLVQVGRTIRSAGVQLHAGHGLNYRNVHLVAAIEDMRELNIGHSIVSRAVFVGLEQAVREMKRLIVETARAANGNRTGR